MSLVYITNSYLTISSPTTSRRMQQTYASIVSPLDVAVVLICTLDQHLQVKTQSPP
ncbi:hypothetical protein Hanom_Chr00s001792g01687871 [Helianthus anomalus]